MKSLVLVGAFIVVASLLIGTSGYLFYQDYSRSRCEACGMVVSAESDINYKIYDTSTNQRLWACCSGCMLRLAAAHPDLHVDALDSWYGESAQGISIDIADGNVSSVSPNTAFIILGSKVTNSCVSNRIALNQTSAQLLLVNGYNANNPLSPFKTSVPAGAPLLTTQQALVPLKAKGIQYSPPSPLMMYGTSLAGVAVLVIGIIAWRKLSPTKPSQSGHESKKNYDLLYGPQRALENHQLMQLATALRQQMLKEIRETQTEKV